MAFPSNPNDGDPWTEGPFDYVFVAAGNAWKKVSAVPSTEQPVPGFVEFEQVANEAGRLAVTTLEVGDTVKQTDNGEFYRLANLPATDTNNWQPVIPRDIPVDTTNFDKILSATENTTQKALEKLDEYAPSEGVLANLVLGDGEYLNSKVWSGSILELWRQGHEQFKPIGTGETATTSAGRLAAAGATITAPATRANGDALEAGDYFTLALNSDGTVTLVGVSETTTLEGIKGDTHSWLWDGAAWIDLDPTVSEILTQAEADDLTATNEGTLSGEILQTAITKRLLTINGWFDGTTGPLDANQLLISLPHLIVGFDETATLANAPLSHTTGMTGFISLSGTAVNGSAFAFIGQGDPLVVGIWYRNILAGVWDAAWIKFSSDNWHPSGVGLNTFIPGHKRVIADGATVQFRYTTAAGITAIRVAPRSDWANVPVIAAADPGWTVDPLPRSGTQEVVYLPNATTQAWEAKVVDVDKADQAAEPWQAATDYVQGDIRSATEPDTNDSEFGRPFNWFHVPTGPLTSGATFDVTEKGSWLRMALETSPDTWIVLDGDVAGLKLGVFGTNYRLVGASQAVLFPSPGGFSDRRESLIRNDSSNDWTWNHSGIDIYLAGETTPTTAPITIPSGQTLRVIAAVQDAYVNFIGAAPTLAKNVREFITGDVTLDGVVDDFSSSTDGKYYIIRKAAAATAVLTFQPVATYVAAGIQRIRVSCEDWSKRFNAVGVYATDGTDNIYTSNGFPDEGSDYIEFIVDPGNPGGPGFIVATGGDVSVTQIAPVYDNDAEAVAGVGSIPGALWSGSGAGDLSDALYRTRADLVRVTV